MRKRRRKSDPGLTIDSDNTNSQCDIFPVAEERAEETKKEVSGAQTWRRDARGSRECVPEIKSSRKKNQKRKVRSHGRRGRGERRRDSHMRNALHRLTSSHIDTKQVKDAEAQSSLRRSRVLVSFEDGRKVVVDELGHSKTESGSRAISERRRREEVRREEETHERSCT